MNLSTVIHDAKGKPIMDEGSPWTMAAAIGAALLGGANTEGIGGNEKFRRFKLAQKVASQESVEFDESEKKIIKDVTGEAYFPIVVGQIYEALGEK